MVMLPMTLGDSYPPETTPVSTFCVIGKQRDFRFVRPVDHNKSQPTDDKPFLKGAWSRHVTNFKFWDPIHSSGTAVARVVRFCTLVVM